MKKILFAISITLLCIVTSAQDLLKINVTKPGGLSAAIKELDVDTSTITKLIISGNIDVRDIWFMRDSLNNLSEIDMNNVSIKAYKDKKNNLFDKNVLPNSAFKNCKKLIKVEMPKAIISIGSSAFYNCINLSKIMMPKTITRIEYYAFCNCAITGKLIIPDSVSYIGNGAFKDCTGLTGDIIIPNTENTLLNDIFKNDSMFSKLKLHNSITRISEDVFYSCINLKQIEVDIKVPLQISNSVFYKINKTKCQLVVPMGSKAAYMNATVWKDFINITEANFIHYNTQGGNAIPFVTTGNNTNIADTITAVRENYVFKGWFKEADCINSWNFDNDIITSDTTLYAKWEPAKYEVTFNTYGGGLMPDTMVSYNTIIGKTIIPIFDGYNFDAWYKEDSFKNKWDIEKEKVLGNTRLYAKWNFKVSFIGSNVPDIILYEMGQINKPVDPQRFGYAFENWYADSLYTIPYDFKRYLFIKNTSVYAKWDTIKYKISFNTMGGNSINSILAKHNTLLQEPEIPVYGYNIFAGWYRDKYYDQAWDFSRDTITRTMTLYAKWNPPTEITNATGNIKIYPNPVHDNLNIDGYGLQQIVILNQLGIEVKRIKLMHNNSISINVGHLPAGFYFLNITCIESNKVFVILRK